jgi:hypothetical protein
MDTTKRSPLDRLLEMAENLAAKHGDSFTR